MSPAAKAPDESTYSGRFAARLRMLREKAGLSVDDVTEMLKKHGTELAPRTYYSWEAAKREPPLDALPSLAFVFNLKSVRALLPEK